MSGGLCVAALSVATTIRCTLNVSGAVREKALARHSYTCTRLDSCGPNRIATADTVPTAGQPSDDNRCYLTSGNLSTSWTASIT
jgi:hypothetical protein